MKGKQLKWFSIGLTVLVAGLLTVWGIYGIGEYGMALFILTPLLIGMAPAVLIGHRQPITANEAVKNGFTALGIFTLGLLLFAIEGLVCIAMIAPLAAFLTWVGSLIGYALVRKASDRSSQTMLLVLIFLVPTTAYMEKDIEPKLVEVTTSIEIDADPATVWKSVIEFPELEEPDEWLFKAGIAYPISAQIQGTGVGAVRSCNFTTGSFIEPVTRWEEGKLLEFDVVQQPAPLKEISFWDIDAPHLQDYFVSKKGRFKLIALPGGRTRLEGTTWYYHDIRPAFYWQLWSRHIVHKIHERVLEHIRKNAEGMLTSSTK